jgi:hypothetical protein
MNTDDTVLAVATVLCFAGVVRLTWRVRAISAFAAGSAAGIIVGVDPVVAVLAPILVAAVLIGGVYALRTSGQRDDDRRPTRWASRLGAGWLVLSFPAVVVWGSLLTAHWMLGRS